MKSMTYKPNIYRLVSLFLCFTLLHAAGLAQKNKAKDTSGAIYINPADNTFLRKWLVLGPVQISDSGKQASNETQQKVFNSDILTIKPGSPLNSAQKIAYMGKSLTWKLVKSENDVIDLGAQFGAIDYAYAYAMAEIKVDNPRKMLLGIGSDDAIKVWLNGKEIHQSFIGRGIEKDDDLVEIELQKGINQLVLKILDFEYDWGFVIRPVGKDVIAELIGVSAARGDLDNIKLLMAYQPNLDLKLSDGLTAWQRAYVSGRVEVADFLLAKGANNHIGFPDVQDYTNTYILSKLPLKSPAFNVLIAQDGQVIFHQSYGFANLEKKVPANTDTKFRIGSITKQFIGTAILKLQEEGKISLDDKLSKYMPDFPRGDEVTIYHLLTHTSGIHSFTDRNSFTDYVTKKATAKQIVDSIKSWEFDFNPGDNFQYNNSGFFLLGEIIEIVSGKWYGDYLKEEFFIPLGMKNTGVYINENPIENEAIGYALEKGKYVPALNWNMSWAGGAGSLYSTTGDLFLWNEAIFNGLVLNEVSLQLAFTPVKLNNGEVFASMKYGCGWFLNDLRGIDEIAHGGGLHGFISYISRIPDKKLTIVTLTNVTPVMENLNPDPVAHLLEQYILRDCLEAQKSYSTSNISDSVDLNDYTGRYDYGNSMVLDVKLTNSKLMAKMTGQPEFEIFPAGNDEFFWKVVEARIKFMRDEKGIVTHAIHYQGGAELKVPKLPELVILELNLPEIEPRLGKYTTSEGFVVDVFLSDGKLYAQGAGQPRLELLRTGENAYTAKEVKVIIRFITKDDKQIIELEQGSNIVQFRKME